jgi:hypothetical protein
MENFSTPRHRLLPWAANTATLAVVLAATVWSGAQRPAERELSFAEPVTAQHVPEQSPVSLPAKGAKSGAWPVPGPLPTRETLQSVGYLPGTLR